MSKIKKPYISRLTLLSDSIAEFFGRLNPTSPTNTIFYSGHGDTNYECGKCNSLLLEKMDLTFSNAALLCSNCKTYNDANNIKNYSGIPVMLRDIPSLVNNIPAFSYSPLSPDRTIPYYDERDDLTENLYTEWVKEHSKMPGVLFQYTSFYGLTGMLSNHSIWITDVAYMNDTSEMKYAIEKINGYILQKKAFVSDECKELLNRSTITASAFNADQGYLIACFCANDDLLSQWRAYGSGGSGYNIGFSSSDISGARDIQIRRVIYDNKKQDEYVHHTVDSICNLFESIKGARTITDLDSENILPAFAAMLSTHLNEFLFTFKHSAFAEEDEWRIIRRYSNTVEDRKRLKFRQYNSIPVPYMEIGLKDLKGSLPFLPIVQVTHGPALHPQLTKKSLLQIMMQNGYSHAEIKGSSTPLRL